MRRYIHFLEYLLPLLQANLSLQFGLEALSQHQSTQHLALSILQLTQSGHSLSVAMEVSGFPIKMISLVRTGEQSGNLTHMIQKSLELHHSQKELKNTIYSTLAYPAFILLLATATLIFLNITMIPNFKQLLSSQQKPMPPFSAWVFDHSWIGIVLIILMLIITLRCFKPVFSYRKWQLFCLHYATNLNSGIAIIDIASTDFRSLLTQGYTLSTILKIFNYPSILIQMIKTAEATGQLDTAFHNANLYYENLIQKQCTVLKKILPNALLSFSAVMVGTVLFAIYLPILGAMS